MPMMPVDTRMGREVTARAEEAAKVAVQGGLEAREVSAQRAEFAVNMAETQAQRVAEQRSVTTGSLPPLEPGTILASPTRPTINIATPVQGPALQAGPVDAPIQTPVGEPGFDDAVADRVWVMTQARLSNAEIRLTPAELGPVRIQVAVDDGTANVSFQAAQAATREAIEQALPRLRELLAENGLSLGQASVGEDGVRDGHRETPERAAGAAVVDESGDDLDSEAVMADTPRRSGSARSLVDTFA
jgi:flagellar hook-length control protein FliK